MSEKNCNLANDLARVIDGMRLVWTLEYEGQMVVSRQDRYRLIQLIREHGADEVLERWKRYVGCNDAWPGYAGRPVYVFLRAAQFARFARRKGAAAQPAGWPTAATAGGAPAAVPMSPVGDVEWRGEYEGWWETVMRDLGAALPANAFEAWVKPLRFLGTVERGAWADAVIEAPSQFHAGWVAANYRARIGQILSGCAGRDLHVAIRAREDDDDHSV